MQLPGEGRGASHFTLTLSPSPVQLTLATHSPVAGLSTSECPQHPPWTIRLCRNLPEASISWAQGDRGQTARVPESPRGGRREHTGMGLSKTQWDTMSHWMPRVRFFPSCF